MQGLTSNSLSLIGNFAADAISGVIGHLGSTGNERSQPTNGTLRNPPDPVGPLILFLKEKHYRTKPSAFKIRMIG